MALDRSSERDTLAGMVEIRPNMLDLWRRATSLLRHHPILWLPVLVADALGQCLARLDSFLAHQTTRAVVRLATSRSVLGAPYLTQTASTASILVSAILRAILYWGAQYLAIALYTVALLTIALQLRSLAEDRPPHIGQAMASALSDRRSIAIFSLKLLGLVLAGSAVFAVVVGIASLQPHRYMIATMPNVIISITAIFECLVAWIITPAALKLLRHGATERPPRDSIRHARFFAVAAVSASAFLTAVLSAIRSDTLGPYPSSGHLLAYTVFGSFITAMPYIPLLIALSLVAVSPLSGFAANPHGLPEPNESHPEEGRIER